ncbi:MAG TPA: complex I NDUFA9 subunit family protein [Aestuariivirga sp.]|nr:complex I NDUFA9 subunit family protein [Aestuariivirga sp.]
MGNSKLVTVIGGSGFVGRHVVRALAKAGHRVRVACRRPDLAGFTQPTGGVGQVMPVQANLRYPESLAAACEGADTVINLVGVLFDSGAQGFDHIHVEGAEAAAQAARATGASQFIHMSALGADAHWDSDYARSKAEGEARVAQAFPGAVMLRPSVIFGPEDKLFNTFGAMARYSPFVVLIGDGVTKFQPVYVGDVALAITHLVSRGEASGKVYELGGPEVVSMKEMARMVLDVTGRNRGFMDLTWSESRFLGHMFNLWQRPWFRKVTLGLMPWPPFTADQVRTLRRDNVVSAEAVAEGRDLAGLGVAPRNLAAILPSYLYRYRKAGQFTAPTTSGENV